MSENLVSWFQSETTDSKVTEHAVIHTSFGDIHIKLFPSECPKAVENFCTHAKRGYYNGHTFHRVIKSFMIQVIFVLFYSSRNDVSYVLELRSEGCMWSASLPPVFRKINRTAKARIEPMSVVLWLFTFFSLFD